MLAPMCLLTSVRQTCAQRVQAHGTAHTDTWDMKQKGANSTMLHCFAEVRTQQSAQQRMTWHPWNHCELSSQEPAHLQGLICCHPAEARQKGFTVSALLAPRCRDGHLCLLARTSGVKPGMLLADDVAVVMRWMVCSAARHKAKAIEESASIRTWHEDGPRKTGHLGVQHKHVSCCGNRGTYTV